MSIEAKKEAFASARENIGSEKTARLLGSLFDDGDFTELDAFVKSENGYAEVVTAHGFVEGIGVYAFAQNSDADGGAMSKAQAAKIKKLYELALKTGEPIVGIYDSVGGRLTQGAELLASYGELLRFVNRLSGVVPQISVVTGSCFGTQALIAACADVVIVSENASFSLDTAIAKASAGAAAENGVAHILAKDSEDAVLKAARLVSVLPSNNLAGACAIYENTEAASLVTSGMSASQAAFAVCDSDSVIELNKDYGKNTRTAIATINGSTVGVVALDGELISERDCNKTARFVRFCDAFSLPVVSFVNAGRFEDIRAAAKLASAYGEATTAKLSLITGDAFGAVYIAVAGAGSGADLTFAWPEASVSALTPEAEAVIMLGDDYAGKLKGAKDPKAEKAAVVAEFKNENLTALRAAENGYVDDIFPAGDTRERLISAIDMLANKRVSTLPKKHNNLYI